jgi:hypothetical protein
MVIYRNLEPKLMAHLLVESSREYARLRQQGKQVGEEGMAEAEELVAPVTARSLESTS